MAKNDDFRRMKCSFCGKNQDEVRKLIQGPGVYICDECIELCSEIIDEDPGDIDDDFEINFEKVPNNGNGREIGFRVYAKIRKGLVVFQQYVVVGHVLFYQRGFQNQCLYFVIGYDIFKGLDPVHQSGGFRIMGSREILLHSVLSTRAFPIYMIFPEAFFIK
jgi:hypothetical protein